ncbi:hypothetical protein [endosymbiont of Riftia pachyptila]|uniref:Uncharacterized protein n=1 Tax=endosymbiont of Riftia pachyptila (vent Ph05) TaxID=1048808 RepID=G2DA24_9GAMM|nr:hypothetical protein [endosymbiont of Riftia pachyptila]EGV52519.1 hypothetical protein Rifp1Sym_ag00240 [endosymbiont of Riftia pachyptila (vent Ph05)]
MNQTTTGHFLKGFAAGGGVTLLLGASGLYLASLSGAISIDSGKLMACSSGSTGSTRTSVARCYRSA